MKTKEIHAMGKEELKARLNEIRMDLIKQNAQVATGTTPKNSGQIRALKKTVAQILTELNTKERQHTEDGKKQ